MSWNTTGRLIWKRDLATLEMWNSLELPLELAWAETVAQAHPSPKIDVSCMRFVEQRNRWEFIRVHEDLGTTLVISIWMKVTNLEAFLEPDPWMTPLIAFAACQDGQHGSQYRPALQCFLAAFLALRWKETKLATTSRS